MKKATLKQIAEQAGVSVTTVHRALNGKGGCSNELEERIRKIAASQGYSANLAASTLRKQPIQIAMIFPFRDNGGRFGLDQILDGYLEYRREVADLNVVFQEFLLRSSDQKFENYLDMEYPELERVLRQISMEQPVRYDGVIIYGMSVTRRAEALLNRIVAKGTQVVIMERTIQSLEDTCTVQADTKMAGKMAAEVMATQAKGPGTIAVIAQLVPGGDQASEAFVSFLAEERSDLNCVNLPFCMNVDIGQAIAEQLQTVPNLVGIYCTTGRHTCSLLDAMKRLNIQNCAVIGTGLYEETYQALHERKLVVVLDRRSQKVGYMSAFLMLNALIRNRSLPVSHDVPPRLIIRSNSDVHFVKREYQHELDQYSD